MERVESPVHTRRSTCNWHYLISTVNANGSVSPCCGIQKEEYDFGTVTDSSFRDVWRNRNYRNVRRLFADADHPDITEDEPSICSQCPIPEDQSGGELNVKHYLRDAPPKIRKRAKDILSPHSKKLFPPKGLLRSLYRLLHRRRFRHPYEKMRYDNLLLALSEQLAGVEVPTSHPMGLILDPSSACGLRCPLCPVSYKPAVREKALLKWDLFIKIVDELGPYLFFVEFFNWGEPLVNTRLPKMLERLKSYHIETRISSSLSVKLSDEVLESLVDYVDTLTVSIDGFTQGTYEKYRVNGDLALALSNLERIARLKKERKIRRPNIDWQYLVFSFNEHEIKKAQKFARKIGVHFRPAAPFVNVDEHPEWLSTIDKYVMDRYQGVREQINGGNARILLLL